MGFFGLLRGKNGQTERDGDSSEGEGKKTSDRSKAAVENRFTEEERDFYRSHNLRLPNVIAASRKQDKTASKKPERKPTTQAPDDRGSYRTIPLIQRNPSGFFPMGEGLSQSAPQYLGQTNATTLWQGPNSLNIIALRRSAQEKSTTTGTRSNNVRSAASEAISTASFEVPGLLHPIAQAARRLLDEAAAERGDRYSNIFTSRPSYQEMTSSEEATVEAPASRADTYSSETRPYRDGLRPSTPDSYPAPLSAQTPPPRYSQLSHHEYMGHHPSWPPPPLSPDRPAPLVEPLSFSPRRVPPSRLTPPPIPPRSVLRNRHHQEAYEALTRGPSFRNLPPAAVTPVINNVGARRQIMRIISRDDSQPASPGAPPIPPRSINRPTPAGTLLPPPPITQEDTVQRIVVCQHRLEHKRNGPMPLKCHVCQNSHFQYLESCRECGLRFCHSCIRVMTTASTEVVAGEEQESDRSMRPLSSIDEMW